MSEDVGATVAVPDWYPDPMGRHQYRYWDGAAWTDNVSDAGQASIDPLTAEPPPVETAPANEAAAPAPVVQAYAEPQVTAVAPKPKRRTGLLVGLVLGLLVLVAAVGGGAVYVSGAQKARAAAETSIRTATSDIADAELAAESGNDAAGAVEEAKSRLAEAKAKLAAGSLLSTAPYREAQALADEASISAAEVLSQLDTMLEQADTLRESGDYSGAIEAWSNLTDTYPRSGQADEARQAALDMLTGDVTDDSAVTVAEDLQLSIDVAAMFPEDSRPDELDAHVRKRLLDEATSQLDDLQGIASANASWAKEIASHGRISGAVVNAFQNQEYSSSDVERLQAIQGLIGKLGLPAETGRLYDLIAQAASLAAECKSIADNPSRSTSTSETFTSGQIKAVRDKAASMQRKIDEGRTLAGAAAPTI